MWQLIQTADLYGNPSYTTSSSTNSGMGIALIIVYLVAIVVLLAAGWKIFEDARVEHGGARIETATSQIDASLETRWKRVVAALGQDTSWLIQQ